MNNLTVIFCEDCHSPGGSGHGEGTLTPCSSTVVCGHFAIMLCNRCFNARYCLVKTRRRPPPVGLSARFTWVPGRIITLTADNNEVCEIHVRYVPRGRAGAGSVRILIPGDDRWTYAGDSGYTRNLAHAAAIQYLDEHPVLEDRFTKP